MHLTFPDTISPLPHDFASEDLLEALPSAEDLVAASAGAEPPSAPDILARMGAPPAHVRATPLSVRAAMLGMRRGRAFFHHERRVRLEMPDDAAPEVDVWEFGRRTTPVWEHGVLREPKYFSFFQDAPLPSYNPNHRSKWRAHELLHGAVGFYWSPTMGRFDAYVAARLAELLPVVHWYGFDEIHRPRCARHRHRAGLPEQTCPVCEQAMTDAAYWTRERDPHDAHAIAWASQGLEHFRREWRACLTEIAARRPVPSRVRADLDASSDAMGYLRGHWPRITRPSFAAWVERFCVEGRDYAASLPDMMHRVGVTCVDLLSGDLTVSSIQYTAARRRRVLQDIAYRLLLAAERGDALEEVVAQDLIVALAERCAQLGEYDAHAADLGYEEDAGLVTDACDAVVRALEGPDRGEAILAVGHDFLEMPDTARAAEAAQVSEGISSGAPITEAALVGAGSCVEEWSAPFMCGEACRSAGLIAARFGQWFGEHGGDLAMLGELAQCEAWVARGPRNDPYADAFGVGLGEDPEMILARARKMEADEGSVRLHATARRAAWSPEVLEAIFDQPFGEGQQVEVIAAISGDGELILIPVSPAQRATLDLIERRAWRGEEAAFVAECVSLGVVVWAPDAQV